MDSSTGMSPADFAAMSGNITLFNTGPEVNLINCAVTVIPV